MTCNISSEPLDRDGKAVSPRPIIRSAVVSDAPALSRLFARHYAQYKPPSYFSWQFFSADAPAALSIAVSDSDEILGSFGYMRRRLTDGSLVGQVMDMLVDTPYRGRGLFAELAAHAFTSFPDVHLRMVLSNTMGTAAIGRMKGWTTLARVPQYVYLETHSKQYPVALPPSNVRKSVGLHYDTAVDSWRFDRHPVNRYHRLEACGAHGYLKLFVDSTDATRRFGDILRLPSESTEESLFWLRAAVDWFRQHGVQSCGLWAMPGTAAAEIASKAGFMPRQQDRWLCVEAVSSSAQALLKEVLWDVCAADAEFY